MRNNAPLLRKEQILEIPLTEERPALLLCARKGRTMHLWRVSGTSGELPSHPYQDRGSAAHGLPNSERVLYPIRMKNQREHQVSNEMETGYRGSDPLSWQDSSKGPPPRLRREGGDPERKKCTLQGCLHNLPVVSWE